MDATVRRQHAGVADQYVEPTETLDRQGRDGFHLLDLTDVGQERLDRAPALGKRGDGRLERRRTHVAQHDVGVDFPGEPRRQCGAEGAPSAGDDNDASAVALASLAHTSR